jgi:hypothetical protein
MSLLKTLRFAFVLAVVAAALVLPAYAACTDGNTSWRTTGCCECNSAFQQTLWVCDNGTWKNTGYSQCNSKGSCCAFPCCT